jgi:hypothetical protein
MFGRKARQEDTKPAKEYIITFPPASAVAMAGRHFHINLII